MQQMPSPSNQTDSGFHYEQAWGLFTHGRGNEKSPQSPQEKASNAAFAVTALSNTFYLISFPPLSNAPTLLSPEHCPGSLSNPEDPEPL